jgi:hypothetical protein
MKKAFIAMALWLALALTGVAARPDNVLKEITR